MTGLIVLRIEFAIIYPLMAPLCSVEELQSFHMSPWFASVCVQKKFAFCLQSQCFCGEQSLGGLIASEAERTLLLSSGHILNILTVVMGHGGHV